MSSIGGFLGLLLGGTLAWAGQALAQESRLAQQTLHCAAVLELLAPAATPEQASRLQRAVDTFSDLHLRERGESGPAAQAQLLERRTIARAQMGETRQTRAAYFSEDAVVCGAWAEGFLAQGPRYQYMVVYPKVIAAQHRSQYQALAEQTLRNWPHEVLNPR